MQRLTVHIRRPKLIVIGYARHGKDTVCELLRDEYGLSYKSSSEFCAERVVFPAMAQNYNTASECFADRGNNRERWFNIIADYTKADQARIGRELLQEHDIYCGIRRPEELRAVQGLGIAEYTIWVDACDRLPPEDVKSCTVEARMADLIIDNNGTLEDLQANVAAVANIIGA